MLYGVTNAQINSSTWLAADDDGDGVSNGDEMTAGTNPFKNNSTIRVATLTSNATTVSLTFPTVAQKLYTVQATASLNPLNWQPVSGVSVIGDGTSKTLVAPKTAGAFFRVVAQDQSTAGDQVSDWAKQVLGYTVSSTIGSQSNYTHTTLATALAGQNVVTVAATDSSATQPPDAVTAATALGVITFTRAGYQLFSAITVPIQVTGTAVSGVDYTALPTSVTFAAGVNSVNLNVTPLSNATRKNTTTLTVTAQPGGGYTLGSATSASVTIYPSGAPNGTGLTGVYYLGSSSNYTNGSSGSASATYNYTQTSATTGSVVVSYTGTPAVPYTVGGAVNLTFSSGNLVVANNLLNGSYVVTAVAPGSVTVNFTYGSAPASGTGNVTMTPFATITNGANFGGSTATYSYTKGTGTGAVVITYTGTPAIAFAAGGTVAVQFTSGSLFAGVPGTYDNIYTIASVSGKTLTVTVTGSSLPANGNGNATLLPFNASTLTKVDGPIDKIWTTTGPDPSMPTTAYTVRWTGQILPQYTEPYYFTVKSDDGARLWVNGQLLINNWRSGSSEPISPPINLQAGVYYDIRLDYLQLTGTAEVHLNWYSNDQTKQIIPVGRLFPATTGTSGAAAPGITSPTSDVYVLGSGSPYTYTITGSNGAATYSASGLPASLSLSGNVISGTPAAGHYQFIVTITNASGSSSVVVDLNVIGQTGNITRELWTATGPNIADIPTSSAPTTTNTVSSLEDATAYGANQGERLRGYFVAPTTGNYYFWIAASNVAELWISDSNEPVRKVRRAYVTAPGTASRTWNAQSNQKSGWLALAAGQSYYIEVLHNTGSAGTSNLAVGWYLDPTGNTANPLATGAGPAGAAVGGIVPGYVLAPWNNPPTITVPGAVYVANLQGASGLTGISANGGAFMRVNGTSAVLHLNYAGLTSGAVSRRIYAAPVGNNPPTLLFDLDAQDRNYSNLRTSDGGYSWTMQSSDLTSLNSGKVYLSIATVNNPNGELTGTFGLTPGSQSAPALPSYTSPSWTDSVPKSTASDSRFLTQATFGPSPADMTYLQTHTYRAWVENQLSLPATHNVPYLLANLSADPQNPYSSTLFFNSWWKNGVTAPDQLRQRVAFALSEILVVSDTGPLNNNGRTLADYYDTLVDYCFDSGPDTFRDLLKQVTLSSAMGVYLNMQGNNVGNISTGLHPNENYAREIMQLFSVGLYQLWPDGSLVLDSSGNAIATYDQSVITGMARVFTGWNWGQSLTTGRLPTTFNPKSNYLDPMVLVPTHHELGTKILLNNVMIPAAIVTNQADVSYDPNSNPISIQSTDPTLGQGNLVTTSITSTYDLNGLHDLETALDNIANNSSVGPYICRQLIQRLVTSNPKPEYVYRVVRAFNGERNIDGVATGVRGDMKDTVRAILLDPEARDATEAANVGFGKQREPLLRILSPARSFPPTAVSGCSYREIGGQQILVTTPTPHRLTNSDTVFLDTFVDAGGSTTNLPAVSGYSVANITPGYNLAGSTGLVTISSPGYQVGDAVQIQFTSGGLGSNANYNTVKPYTVTAVTLAPVGFTIDLHNTTLGNASGNTLTPYNFTVNNGSISAPSYTGTGASVVVSGSGYNANDHVYITFTGGLAGLGFDQEYTIASATATNFTVNLTGSPPASSSGSALIPKFTGGYTVSAGSGATNITLQTSGAFDLAPATTGATPYAGDRVQIDFPVTNSPIGATNGIYNVVAVPGPNLVTVNGPSNLTLGNQSTTGMIAYPLTNAAWTRNGTLTLKFGTWNVSYSQNDLNQTPLDSVTVFNFFYPSYQYPGAIAQAGMTTPEFQLTNDSNTMNLTNAITNGITNAGNTNGFTSYRTGGGAVVLDLYPYMTSAQTIDTGIPTLTSTLGTLLTGGNLTTATQNVINGYVANTTNFPMSTPPTNSQMRDRVRAILQLILISAEYAIQK